MGSSNFEAAQSTSICEHLKEPMVIISREAAQIIPLSEYLKEPMVTFRREGGQWGSSASQGVTEAALRAVLQVAAVVPFMQWWPHWRPRGRQPGCCLRRAGLARGV